MTRRFNTPGGSVSPLLLACLIAVPVYAQPSTPLRPSFGGHLLPQGTELVVLHKPAAISKDGLFQPEFFSKAAYPLRRDLLLRRDALSGSNRTHTSYPGTQAAGVVYFLYALTPDSTLYWSYSPPKDSLKFDVVNQGVMSVAPVTDAGVRREIVGAFFRPSPDESVAVIMRNRPARVDSAAVSDSVIIDEDAQPADIAATADTSTSRSEPVVAQSGLAAMATASPAAPTLSGGVNYSIFFSMLGAMLLLAAIPVYFMRRYHDELAATRKEIFALRMQQLSATPHPDRVADLQQALQESNRQREQSERAYAVLQTRYQELLRELNRGDVSS